ncbi:DNA-directed RNA polymerase subunit epsilon [Streptococcus zalophi]|uniref:DNA-directed RNA polymerase subunit epsilon n=1 Tax=Streptococcus zalophi TaxID=640031 RepID=A0A934UDM7_9STRE|nr:DNA-directed RNA polymerase subunit epsilon [Streptococcus zalophi]MBJ8349982.1 DNA-dependent RNA polymerase auxiliary subunit epsilon family protein [Streptococcus zalophi]MCR8966977.1 DNA-directed RNA polymerase subunit epsilon [Streptococcus zalophi]
MIYKVFYQDSKDNSPRREQTKSIYLDITADNELKGRIIARQLVEEKTNFNVEYIEALSEKHLAYEKETGAFELTEL